jgi:hypothetical protein
MALQKLFDLSRSICDVTLFILKKYPTNIKKTRFWRFAGRGRGPLAWLARLARCMVAVLPYTPSRFARRRT